MVLTLGITCYFALHVTYINDRGVTETGYPAARKLRAVKKEWAGPLDEKKLRAVIEENTRINALYGARPADSAGSEIAYGRKQGFDDIRHLLNDAYADAFRSYDYYRADSLKAGDEVYFYENRITLLKDWLCGEAKYQYSDTEKEFILEKYETLDTPFLYDYSEGWHRLFEYSPTVIMITVLILGYLVAGIFSNEFGWKTDSVFYASMYGRDRAVSAKIKAGFCIATAVYWAMMVLYSAIVLLYLGADGAGCPVQADRAGYKCLYHITLWQEYLLILAGGYIGCLFMSFLAMYVSAKTKSAVPAVTAPFILIFLPSFLSGIRSPAVARIIGLLPDNLLQINNALRIFDLHIFFGKAVGAIPVLFSLYGALTLVLVPFMYREYRGKQVR